MLASIVINTKHKQALPMRDEGDNVFAFEDTGIVRLISGIIPLVYMPICGVHEAGKRKANGWNLLACTPEG